MNKEEFIDYCVTCGYANKVSARKYTDLNKKRSYDTEDAIEVYRKNNRFKGCRVCGFSYIPNGRTTAFQNS